MVVGEIRDDFRPAIGLVCGDFTKKFPRTRRAPLNPVWGWVLMGGGVVDPLPQGWRIGRKLPSIPLTAPPDFKVDTKVDQKTDRLKFDRITEVKPVVGSVGGPTQVGTLTREKGKITPWEPKKKAGVHLVKGQAPRGAPSEPKLKCIGKKGGAKKKIVKGGFQNGRGRPTAVHQRTQTVRHWHDYAIKRPREGWGITACFLKGSEGSPLPTDARGGHRGPRLNGHPISSEEQRWQSRKNPGGRSPPSFKQDPKRVPWGETATGRENLP